jgi:hypothetical protein
MTVEEIQERNKQIALMLGFKYKNQAKYWGRYPLDDNSFLSKLGYVMMCNLKFHSDWNWLMEAVYHLELKLVKPVNITQGMCTISRGYAGESKEPYVRVDKWRMGSKEFNYDYKKEAVFIAVSDFAKLYNDKQ